MHQGTAASACVSLTCRLPLMLKTEFMHQARIARRPPPPRYGMDIEMRQLAVRVFRRPLFKPRSHACDSLTPRSRTSCKSGSRNVTSVVLRGTERTARRASSDIVAAIASQSLRQTGLAECIGKGLEVLGALEREPFTKFAIAVAPDQAGEAAASPACLIGTSGTSINGGENADRQRLIRHMSRCLFRP